MKFFNRIKSFFQQAEGVFNIMLFVALIIYLTVMIGRELMVLSPVITLAFVTFGTLFAFRYRWTAIRSIFGILLYVAGWPIYDHFGVWAMIAIYATGFALWFEAGLRGFITPMLPVKA